MGHESYARTEKLEGSSNRSFGLVFAAVFGIIALLPLIFGRMPRLWALGVGGLFFIVALLAPALLAPFNRLWFKLGLLLHRIVSPVALGVVFFGVITPMALVMRLLGKDPLRLRFDPTAPSYWIERQPPGPTAESLKDQF